MEPLISVLVPVYNVEEYLPRCLDSVIGQTYSNLEIILVNDGSTDGSGEVCDRYAAKDNRVRVIHTENRGVAAARNKLVTEAAGAYFMFVDSDDCVSRNAIQLLLERMQQDKSDLVIGKHISVHMDGSCDNRYCRWMKDAVLSQNEAFLRIGEWETFWFGMWGKLYKAELFEGIVFPALVCGEDTWVFPLIIERCNTISVLDQVIYYYTQRQDSIVHQNTERKKKDDLEATLQMTACLWQNNYKLSANRWYQLAVRRGFLLKSKAEAYALFRKYLDRKAVYNMMRQQDLKTIIKGAMIKIGSRL